ncbi:MAG: restriction endonuclease PLD domain-containing protein [bacterium]
MEILYSSVIPVRPSGFPDFRETFERQFLAANELKIASGYISEDSLMELKAILAHHEARSEQKTCDLIIGMHGREGFTPSQYEAACSLGTYLRDHKIGEVRVCSAFKFHGKVYSFLNHGNAFASILGSSNLSGILGLDAQWETDSLITEAPQIKQLVALHNELVAKATKPLLEFEGVRFVNQHDLLEGRIGVERASYDELEKVRRSAKNLFFEIPLKAEERSNLNAYFGKGRESQTGAIRPRPWYEVEIIVPVSITSKKGYPVQGKPFTAYTDDGWKFRCKVSGQNSKNFRSEDDLQTLGRWVKGRMEASRTLKVGELVTSAMLQKYGRESITLTATQDADVWLLDFSAIKI